MIDGKWPFEESRAKVTRKSARHDTNTTGRFIAVKMAKQFEARMTNKSSS